MLAITNDKQSQIIDAEFEEVEEVTNCLSATIREYVSRNPAPRGQIVDVQV